MRYPFIERVIGPIAPEVQDLISWRMIMRGTGLIMLVPVMVLIILLINGLISPFALGISIILTVLFSLLFIYPYIANLAALTNYVRQLSYDHKVVKPNLGFLNNVQELTDALDILQESWDRRKRQLENIVAEGKILLDVFPDVLVMTDRNFNIIRTSRHSRKMFGKDNYLKVIHDILLNPELRKKSEAIMNEELEAGAVAQYHVGHPYELDLLISIERFPAYAPGNVELIFVMHDITQQKLNERMMADFVANASHEIKTPLTTIMGLIETLQSSARDDPEAVERFLSMLEVQSERMSNLVRDLLSLSQIERNLYTVPTDEVDILPILDETIHQLKLLADKRNMRIGLYTNGDMPEIIADRREISQIFENLISNAIKYGNDDSEVRVEVMIMPNNPESEGVFSGVSNVISVKVIDEGEGISPEHINRLTERFYRVDKARSRRVGGTGLGLAIVKYIIDRHKGRLDITSEVGKGSCFQVSLPVRN